MPPPAPISRRRLARRAFILGGLSTAAAAITASSRLGPLGGGPWRPPAPAVVTTVDTLDYFLRKRPEGLTGSHLLAQVVDHARRRSYYLKGDAQRYEVHTWDETGIYLVLDRDPERAYGLAPGLWMGRRMTVGDEIVVSGSSTITWLNQACGVRYAEPYSYTIKLERHEPAYELGGDLGRQAVIILRYLPAGGRAERFYYSQDWGWVGWEEYDDNGRVRHRSRFNRIMPHAVRPAVAAPCDAMLQRSRAQ